MSDSAPNIDTGSDLKARDQEKANPPGHEQSKGTDSIKNGATENEANTLPRGSYRQQYGYDVTGKADHTSEIKPNEQAHLYTGAHQKWDTPGEKPDSDDNANADTSAAISDRLESTKTLLNSVVAEGIKSAIDVLAGEKELKEASRDALVNVTENLISSGKETQYKHEVLEKQASSPERTRTTHDARISLVLSISDVSDLKKTTEGLELQELDEIIKITETQFLPKFRTSGSERYLTTNEEVELNDWLDHVAEVYERNFKPVQIENLSALESIRIEPLDTSEVEAELVEAMHQAFKKGNVDQIKQITEILGYLKKRADTVKNLNRIVKEAANLVGASKTLSQLIEAQNFFNKTSDYLGHAKNLLNTGRALLKASGVESNVPGANYELIDKFEAELLGGIDTTMSFSKKVPFLGNVWKKYYSPMIKEILNGLRKIAEKVETKEKIYAVSIGWYANAIRGNPKQAPQIPHDYLDHFPGGQAVFDYLWGIMSTGGSIKPSQEVILYFKYNQQAFMTATEKEYPLILKNPGKLFAPVKSKGESELFSSLISFDTHNFDSWAVKNRKIIWGMLYGRHFKPPEHNPEPK